MAGSPRGRRAARKGTNTTSTSGPSGSLQRPGRTDTTSSTTSQQTQQNRLADRLSTGVIDVDSSFEDVMENRLINFSNNSNTTEGYSCTVLHCEATFTSEGALGQHMNLFQHSPCNPRLRAVDCKLSPDILCYCCPDCDREFSSAEECKGHMTTAGHSVYMPPLEISAFMCPQCLYLFESFEKCWNHIEKSSHHSMAFPFTGIVCM